MNENQQVMNRVTLGTAGLGGAWHPVDFEESIEAILHALDQGITHIDMAPAYMDAELIIGRALEQWNGAEVFLSTKVGKKRGRAEQEGLVDYTIDSIKSSLNISLKRLNRDNVDLLFLHEPDQVPPEALQSVIDTLLSFKQQGMAKKIGLGGKPSKLLTPYIKEGYFDVVMDFNGFNILERKGLKDFPFYRKHKLEIYEGSPLMMGLLGMRLNSYSKSPPAWISAEMIKQATDLQVLASKYNMTLATMAHRFLLFSNEIDRMVVGPANYLQLEATLSDIKIGPLDSDLLKKIQTVINK